MSFGAAGLDPPHIHLMSSSQNGHAALSNGGIRTENTTLNGNMSLSEKDKAIETKEERVEGRDLEAAAAGVVAVDDTAPGGMSDAERKQLEAQNPNIVDWEPNDPGFESSNFRTTCKLTP